tara:strand:- start:272 stop:394 length:123 start_codon:yes stop_codon:yes gene_type:complete
MTARKGSKIFMIARYGKSSVVQTRFPFALTILKIPFCPEV